MGVYADGSGHDSHYLQVRQFGWQPYTSAVIPIIVDVGQIARVGGGSMGGGGGDDGRVYGQPPQYHPRRRGWHICPSTVPL